MKQRDDASGDVEPGRSDSGSSPQSSVLTKGPDGNTILCDSPLPSDPPAYGEPSQALPASDARMAPSSASTTRHDSSARKKTERVKPRRAIGNYSLGNTLGSGSMGKVRLAVHSITQDKLAVKIVPRIGTADRHRDKKTREKDESREVRTIREASIMLLLHHPYIVSLKEMVVLDPYYYLFMEYVDGGQLLDYIISHGKLKEKQARRFARQIVSALDYCHRNSIVHRDLKIENILISRSGQIKIIDFGLSNLFSPSSHLSTFCGSLYFAAPELLNAKAYKGPEVDVWSFGIVLYVLTCGKVPFDDQNMAALHEKIKRGTVEYPTHLSTDCKNLMACMLVVNPARRATISEITVHPWMNRGYDGPVDNHLQERAPLSLPVDMQVVRGMTGFGFGTEAEIRSQLEKIITSNEYQKAAKTLVERTAEAQRSHVNLSHQSPHMLTTSRFAQHSGISRSKSFTLPNDDPQSIPAAYHPLVSIYYLVKERLDRERRAAEDTNMTGAASNAGSFDETPHSFRVPELPIPETAHAPNTGHSSFGHPTTLDSHLHLFGRGTAAGVAYGKRGKTNIRVDEQGRIIELDRHNTFLENGFGRLFARPSTSHRSSSTSGEQLDVNEEEADAAGRETGMLRRLSLAISRTSAEGHRSGTGKHHTRNQSTGASINSGANSTTPIPTPSKSENRSKHCTTSYGTSYPNSLHAAAHEEEHGQEISGGGLGQKFGKILSRRGTTGAGSPSVSNSTGHQVQRDRTLTPGHPISASVSSSHHEEGRIGLGKMPVQSLPTAKKASGDNNVAENETQQHYHEQVFPPSANGSRRKGMADEQVKPVFLKGLFSVATTSTKHSSVIRADLIRVLERIGVKWRESKGRFECVHVPSIDMNRVLIDESEDEQQQRQQQQQQQTWSLSDEDQSSAPNGGGTVGAMGGGMPITVPDLVVRFEIYIVKVPWLLGMHGIQFRRVSGDPWQYKNMCSRILAELKL